ncbi:hypothetical protein DUI87_30433 [Hirundo rustica rustica]|uniref:Uncharacterized protein n=1 Tax=Hirundo rustica rustica TaxID=333673 RepID=A0A3M0IX81_HIRRU|nr:hypothetical protein DUI87_30433 [Hirundo rustica rustica]
MALALRLILLLLLAVALPARTAQAAPWRVQGAVKPVVAGDLDSQPTSKTEPLGDVEDWERDMDYLEMMVNGGLKAVPEAEGKSATHLL